ncbi:methylated-DNA--[protein]-cysteine S-methyltransferase [Myroides sp. TSA_177.3]|jgi:AraC family transcriptional regulator of adaptative response/methylated-DNA-[protein]-cysteine methyltransferase|uniref:methylated-DNA--[protein]-cysteine S-methyltransferase n=1 Tax=Myroides sp. TSA_177.3 TaxID=3415650 RepID=UPI002833B7EB|nr:methylated-DNA--[protein]-cysteine S-methyltransferase [Myroides odoratus]
MKEAALNYTRIAEAIEYIHTNFKRQPRLDEVANALHLSPAHFQRLFTEWAGTSPKKFLQFTSLEYAKWLLKDQQVTLFDATFETGLSSTSRLHDLFITLEGMTPAEYQHGGQQLTINYSFASSFFGPILIASTAKGICHLVFVTAEAVALQELKAKFPQATFQAQTDQLQLQALKIFQQSKPDLNQIKLHLKGTEFQLKVWQSLLAVPMGELTTYGAIAQAIDNPKASRAVGTAIGNNPIAFLIPCHRVIQSSGVFGNYMWGATRKTAIIGWEGAQVYGNNESKNTADGLI